MALSLVQEVLSKAAVRTVPSKPEAAQVPFPFLFDVTAEEENHMGWFCVEDDGNQIKKERHPLLVGHMPVTVAKQQEFKVMGGGLGVEAPFMDTVLPAGGAESHVAPRHPL